MDKKGFYTFPPVDTPLKGAENYVAWALTMQYNLKAFGVWGYVQGKIKCPSEPASSSTAGTSTSDSATTGPATPASAATSGDALTVEKWNRTDDQIQAYIMRSVIDSIRMNIGRLTSSRDQWSALQRMYVQSGSAREYQLIQALQDARQDDCSIQEFYSLLSSYWEELQALEPPLPDGIVLTYPVYILDQQKQRDQRNLFHFAMRLRPEFETLRGNILHRSPLPNITNAVSEFIAEEIRLRILTPAQPSM